ncbi:MAG: LysR family transcriptional regulator ArgP [Ideonella sp.]|jgi:LysR family transcriptional regulator (chromosome initiation inhibitor)|nr:LysR family transcriptional regulator ArgP [Ideonella sp.]
MNLDYAQLAALAAVVREGSFDAAARTLHVTPSAISQRIRALEERCGAVLVTRDRPCRATEFGAPLCRHAERVALLEQELRTALPAGTVEVDPARVPTLRIAVNADSLATWFVSAAAAFVARHEALLDIVIEDQDHTVQALRRGEVLAAVTAHAAPVQGCRSFALGRMAYAAVASPAFVARHFGHGVDARSLRRAPSLRFNAQDDLQDRWVRRHLGRAVELPRHGLPSTGAFVEAARLGLGWGLNPVTLVEPLLARGELVELVRGRRLDTPLHWQCTRLATPALEALTDSVRAAARSRLRG